MDVSQPLAEELMGNSAHEHGIRVLLVEDDHRLREELLATLEEAGYSTVSAGTLSEARRLARSQPDVVLLDRMLPDGDGLELCTELRNQGSDVPIIALTARDAIEARVEGLDSGVDDYLVKPFSVAELMARLRSATRRYLRRTMGDRVTVGDLWIDRASRLAGRGSRPVELTPQEYDLLAFLLANPGVTWSRDQLLRHAWGLNHTTGDQRTVDTHVRRLRVKLEDDPARPEVIRTVWGSGYRLDARR